MNRICVWGCLAAFFGMGLATASEATPDTLKLPDDLQASLFASEPLLSSPSDIDVDVRGRVWVCEVLNYRGKKETRKEGDRILVLEDTDGDGKADKQTVFYQGRDVDSALGICVIGEGPGRKVIVSCAPDVYQAEQARVRERFENAVELAEQAFATELQRLTAHLAERLTGLHDGQPKVFRASAVENLREFFERFRRLNIRSSPELDMLVEEAQQVITGIEPQQLRDSVRLRQMVARDFEQIQASVGEMLVDRPRRNILRRGNVGGAV
jgi:hypothetical protein